MGLSRAGDVEGWGVQKGDGEAVAGLGDTNQSKDDAKTNMYVPMYRKNGEATETVKLTGRDPFKCPSLTQIVQCVTAAMAVLMYTIPNSNSTSMYLGPGATTSLKPLDIHLNRLPPKPQLLFILILCLFRIRIRPKSFQT